MHPLQRLLERTDLVCRTMHYDEDEPAKKGLLISDAEWESSNCYGPKDRWLYGDQW